MAMQVINDPYASRSSGLGSAAGSSLGSMLTNLATQKARQRQQGQQSANIGEVLEALGVPRDVGMKIGMLPQGLQSILFQGLLSGGMGEEVDQGGQGYGAQQPMDPESKLSPDTREELGAAMNRQQQPDRDKSLKMQQRKLRSLFTRFGGKTKKPKHSPQETKVIIKTLTGFGMPRDQATEYASLPPAIFSKVLSDFLARKKEKEQYQT